MLICFDGPGCHVINIHEKSSHCETLKSNRKKINKFFTNICDLKENYRTTFYLTKNSARLRLKLTSLVKGYFRSHECMSLFGREPPSTNVYSGLSMNNLCLVISFEVTLSKSKAALYIFHPAHHAFSRVSKSFCDVG